MVMMVMMTMMTMMAAQRPRARRLLVVVVQADGQKVQAVRRSRMIASRCG